MATFKTGFASEQENAVKVRNAFPSHRGVQQPLRYAKFEYTLTGDEANTDVIVLGSLQTEGAVIVPELCSVWNTGSGDADLDVTLQNATGAVALSGAASVDNSRVALARPAGLTVPVLKMGDFIQVTLSSVEAATADEVLHFEIAYRGDKTGH